MFQTTRGLILREVRYKEADRILTILTESEGKITAKARGALRKSSRTGAACSAANASAAQHAATAAPRYLLFIFVFRSCLPLRTF